MTLPADTKKIKQDVIDTLKKIVEEIRRNPKKLDSVPADAFGGKSALNDGEPGCIPVGMVNSKGNTHKL